MFDHIGQIPAAAALKFSNQTALIFEDEKFSFNEINSLVEKAAGGLSELGILPGDTVTLYAENSWEWIISYYAIARLGAVINPVNTMLTPEELEYVAKDCGAKAIITSSDKVAGIWSITEVSDVSYIISFGAKVDESVVSFDTLIATDSKAPHPTKIAPTALSTIGYTSGTTGHPKGAMQSHQAVIINAAMTSQMQMRGHEDCIISALPCPHVYANVIMMSMMKTAVRLCLKTQA